MQLFQHDHQVDNSWIYVVYQCNINHLSKEAIHDGEWTPFYKLAPGY